MGKKHPPVRSDGEWGAYPLIGSFIGPYLFRKDAVQGNPGVWVTRGFQSMKQCVASTCWSRCAQHSEGCFVFGNCLRSRWEVVGNAVERRWKTWVAC